MRRFGFALVSAGAVALLVGLFALSRAITAGSDDSTTAVPAPDRTGSTANPTPSGSSRTTTPSALPSASPLPSPTPSPATQSPSKDPWQTDDSPRLAEENAPPGTRLNTKNLHYGGQQLRAQIEANAPHIEACIRKVANKSRPTGEATLTFVLAMQEGKVIVEHTDIARDATTLEQEPLLDCMAKAAHSMQFKGLPREAPAISVTRLVKLEAGQLVENKLVTFSYIR